MNWKSPKYTVSITWAAPVPRNTVISHLRADNCLRAASLASFPRTFTVSALKAHLIPRILKGSGSMGAMFSPGILGEWEGIWIQNFLWTVSYLSPLGIFFPSFLPTFLCSFLLPSLSPFLSFSFLKIKKKNYFLAVLWGLLDLSSQSRDWTKAMAVKAPGPNHLITREFPKKFKKSLDVKDMNYLFWQMSCLCYLWLFQQ